MNAASLSLPETHFSLALEHDVLLWTNFWFCSAYLFSNTAYCTLFSLFIACCICFLSSKFTVFYFTLVSTSPYHRRPGSTAVPSAFLHVPHGRCRLRLSMRLLRSNRSETRTFLSSKSPPRMKAALVLRQQRLKHLKHLYLTAISLLSINMQICRMIEDDRSKISVRNSFLKATVPPAS